MKILNNIICLVAFPVMFYSCTDGFEGLNLDQKRISDESLVIDANEGGFQLPGMQLGVVDVLNTARFEMLQNLNADNYSGYMSLPSPFTGNRNTSTYAMVDNWNNKIWEVPSSLVLDQWVSMKKKRFDEKYPDLFALGTIFKVFAGHRIVDTHGPIPYTLYGTASEVAFDSEEEAYYLFFEELRESVAVLREFESSNPDADQIRYAKFDKSRYGGDYDTWIKVANTLRLRLAMRISGVDPVKAKFEAEAAINDGGVLTESEGSFEMSTGTVHPLYTITNAWQETRLNASLECYLKGFNDPRLPIYALPSTHELFKGEYKGARSGALYDKGNFIEYSKVNFENNPYVKLMDVSESYFLRAEGALKGWDMGGTAKEFYEAGIRSSFNNYGVAGVDDYLENDHGTQIDYIDPINEKNNAKAVSNITIKWEENVTDEEKLEKIITQKWLAIYPMGQESWSEFRRTGYPKLWPVVVNFSDGEVPEGEFIKRIPYASTIRNASRAALEEAVSKFLNSNDSMFEPLWWDVD